MSASKKRKRRRKLPKARDLFFGLIATLILFHEIVIAESPRPLAAFLILFFYGMIPVGIADDVRRAAATWIVPKVPEPENGTSTPDDAT